MKIILPLPPKELSPNARCHWKPLQEIKRRYRTGAFLRTLEVLGRSPKPMLNRATTTITFYHSTGRFRDADNALASLKAGLDGITDAGVMANDHGFRHNPIEFMKDRDNPRVEIIIDPFGDEA
jgi:crossover junction endodeoxyribonuclease RusA